MVWTARRERHSRSSQGVIWAYNLRGCDAIHFEWIWTYVCHVNVVGLKFIHISFDISRFSRHWIDFCYQWDVWWKMIHVRLLLNHLFWLVRTVVRSLKAWKPVLPTQTVYLYRILEFLWIHMDWKRLDRWDRFGLLRSSDFSFTLFGRVFLLIITN